MSKRYLFSPVGNTDPIKYFSDGSMLHICRVYQPDIVYLYMSQEIYKCHLKDDRYVKTLHLLGDKLDHHFDIRLVIREELVDVQQYDFFYKDFRACIADIERQMDDGDQLLLNMASGTPAMKSALVVMATLAEYRFTPIQVSTPLHGSNLEHEERKEYDVETNWELDKDNKEDFHNRCEAVKCMNLFRLLKLDMLKKHLRAYDYHAAAAVSRELNPGLTQENQKLLDAAEARINLDWNTLVKLSVHKIRAFAPVSDTEKRKIFEYVLGLKIKLKKGEYADFVRAITPVVVDLMELCVKKYCGVHLDNYCTVNEKGVKRWDANKLKNSKVDQVLLAKWPNFKYDVVYGIHLNEIVQSMCSHSKVCRYTRDLVDVEQKIRNVAAHEIVSVTDEWIYKKTQSTPESILEKIQFLCDDLKINDAPENWDSYDKMNEYIIQMLDHDSEAME